MELISLTSFPCNEIIVPLFNLKYFFFFFIASKVSLTSSAVKPSILKSNSNKSTSFNLMPDEKDL